MNDSPERPKRFLYWLLIAAGIAIAYAPLLMARYGFGDDFILLLSDQPDLASAYLIDGRPLFALSQLLVHDPIESLWQLSLLRGLACVATIGCAIFFFEATRPLGGTESQRACLAVCLGLLPSLHTYVAQANFWLATFAALLTLAAMALMVRCTRPQPMAPGFRLSTWAFAQVLMLVTGAIYQPMLSWYWVGVFVMLLDPRFLTEDLFRKQVYRVIVLGLLSFVLCFLAFKFYFVLFDSGMKERTQLTQNPLEKIYWYARIQLPLALNYWHLVGVSTRTIPLAIAAASAMVILSGYLVECRRMIRRTRQSIKWVLAVRAGLLLGVGMLTHTHWLVIADCPQSYRVIAPLGVTVFIAICWSVGQWLETISGEVRGQRIRGWLAAGLLFVVVIVCQLYSVKYWILPHETAFRYLTASIRWKVTPQTERLHLIRQSRDDGFVKEMFIESHGSPVTEREWMVREFAAYALRESGVPHDIQRITHSGADAELPVGDNTVIIDMRDLVQFRSP